MSEITYITYRYISQLIQHAIEELTVNVVLTVEFNSV